MRMYLCSVFDLSAHSSWLALMYVCVYRCRGLDCLAVVEYLREKLQNESDKVVLVSAT